MLRFLPLRARRPSSVEERVFESFADEVRSVAARLSTDARLVAPNGSVIDLGNAKDAEFALVAIETAARDHLNRREDLLALHERATAMAAAGARQVAPQVRIDAALYLLRAVAMSELLVREATTRFRGDARTSARASDALQRLAVAVATTLGRSLPANLGRAFPRFARAVIASAEDAPAYDARSEVPRAAAASARRKRSSSPSTFRA
jgi:hypothetical protein